MGFIRSDDVSRSRLERWSHKMLRGLEQLEHRLVLSATVGDAMPEIAFVADAQWNTGYTGNITITNDEANTIDDWTLEFDLEAEISSIWNARIVDVVGNHYTIEHASWNGQISPGTSVSLGFVAAGGVGQGATNFVFNGQGQDPQVVPIEISIDDVVLAETDEGNVSAQLNVMLSRAATEAITVEFSTQNGTATAGEDYAATSGTLTFAPGETSKNIAVAVLGDTLVESDETFKVILTGAVGATIVDAEGLVSIEDNDQASPVELGAVEFTVVSDWGTGFTGQITIANEDASAWNNWTLEFDFAGNIPAGSIWNATIAEHSGDHYVIKPASWNASVAAGASVSFGFNGSRANADVVPTNYVLNGTVIDEPVDPEDPIDPEDPETPTLSVEDAQISEGDEGQTTVTLTARLSAASDEAFEVAYQTIAGTATEGVDYVAATGVVTFAPGETEKEISIAIVGDTDFESAESLSVLLSSASLGDATATITVFNDDPNPNGGGEQRVVAYYPEWAVYARDYHIQDVPAENLTHLIYAFAQIKDGEIAVYDTYAALEKAYPTDTWDQDLRGTYNQVRILKEQNPDLRVLIAVGGWTLSGEFSDMAATEASRAKFAASAVEFITTYGFDGIDLDWEYPVEGGMSPSGRAEDTQNYTLLVEELREQFDAQSAIDGNVYEITVASPAGYDKIANFDLAGMAQHIDWFNVMTYDYHGTWESTTNHNAPLYGSTDDPSSLSSAYNIDYTIQLYLAEGVASDQLVLGVPLYGRAWSGVDSTNGGLYQDASGAAPGTWEPGNYDYSHIVELLAENPDTYTLYWDDQAMVPYVYGTDNGGTFITFETEQSVQMKIDYVMANELGGMFFWEISADGTGDDSLVTQAAEQILV